MNLWKTWKVKNKRMNNTVVKNKLKSKTKNKLKWKSKMLMNLHLNRKRSLKSNLWLKRN